MIDSSPDQDPELKALAALALANSFYRDYSTLVQAYMDAACGLDADAFEERISTMSNPYSRASVTNAPLPSIAALGVDGSTSTFHTLSKALDSKTATEVLLNGNKVFEMRTDGWFFTG